MTGKPMTPATLAAVSARVAGLIRQGGRTYIEEVQRRAAEQDGDAFAPMAKAPPGPFAAMPGAIDDVIRLRGAMEVALALLDELLEPMPAEPDGGYALEIADMFQEIGDIAAKGAYAARQTAFKEEG